MTMKRTYISPVSSELLMEVEDMMAISLLKGAEANEESVVLTKENDWDFWSSDVLEAE